MADDLRRRYKARFDGDLEPESYEIVDIVQDAAPHRRQFLKVLGGGVLFLVTVRTRGLELPVRVQLADDGTARAFTGKMEMGQGSRTLLTQAFAEELDLPVGRVQLVMGDTDLCPDDGGTWASVTTPQTVPVIRKAAAAVRAQRHRTSDAVTPPSSWKTLGHSVPHVSSRDIVTGARVYPSDVRVPALLHAAIVRSPYHKASLISVDASKAEQLPDVRIVRDGDLLAALAPTPAAARAAAALVTAAWKPTPLTPQRDWPGLFARTAVEPVEQLQARYPPLLRKGDVAAALAAAAARRTSSYWVAPIAHVPMEPRAAVAAWTGDAVTIQCGVQAPFLVRQEVARALDVPESRVRVVVVDSGGAFGGKQRGECEVEAARLSRRAGSPVRVAWTREEEFTCSYTRPAGLLEIDSGVGADGRLTAMRFANYNSGAAGLAPQYDIPSYRFGFWRATVDVRQGSYRSLAAVANNFALESHMDEWAEALAVDPVQFRLRHITDARLREVIETTAARFGWTTNRGGNGRGIGMSCNLEKDARLALFVEIEMVREQVRIRRMTATGDFGAALNPDALRNQMTGAIIQGIGGALWERVDFDGDAQTTRRLSEYRVPRFTDVPAIDVELIDRRAVASAGAGESPITLTAPALASAIHAATGARHRSLPLMP